MRELVADVTRRQLGDRPADYRPVEERPLETRRVSAHVERPPGHDTWTLEEYVADAVVLSTPVTPEFRAWLAGRCSR